MKMCKTVPIFLLLFTGISELLYNRIYATATPTMETSSPVPTTTEASKPVPKTMETPSPVPAVSVSPSPASTAPQDPAIKQQLPTQSLPERHLSALLVAGISISLVFLFILVMIGVWCLWKKSQQNSAEINSIPSGQPGLLLEKMSTEENQRE